MPLLACLFSPGWPGPASGGSGAAHLPSPAARIKPPSGPMRGTVRQEVGREHAGNEAAEPLGGPAALEDEGLVESGRGAHEHDIGYLLHRQARPQESPPDHLVRVVEHALVPL